MFDTAPHYGLGLSERRLGAALVGRPRDEFVFPRRLAGCSDKSGADGLRPLRGGFAVARFDLTRVWDLSADGVRRSLEESLDRLGLDRVDIVFVHDPDDAVDQAIDGNYSRP